MSNNAEDRDILGIFKTAVYNGQTRLALEALVEVIDAIVEIIAPAEEIPETENTPTIVSPMQNPITEQPREEKPSSKKKVKEETTA